MKKKLILLLAILFVFSITSRSKADEPTTPVCGNQVTEAGETCDDGNTESDDGCSSVCQLEYCGNGCLENEEECDDNNRVNGDGCTIICTIEKCGNSIFDIGEECDDGNSTNGDGCSKFCEIEVCGNGKTEIATVSLTNTPQDPTTEQIN